MDPRRYGRVDRVFALGFGLVVAGALGVFLSGSAAVSVSSVAGMFVGVCVMLVCLGVEDGSEDEGAGSTNPNSGFKDGDTFEECEMGRGIGREKGPKGRT